MKPVLSTAIAAACLALAGPVVAQEGVRISKAEVTAFHDMLKGPCAAGPTNNKACAVLVYTPEDCAKEKDPYTRMIYNTYDDGTVRFASGTQVARQPAGVLMAGAGVFNARGETTRYINPQMVSWQAYQDGQKTLPICGKDARIGVKDFEIPKAVQAFLKANP
jgi:hypothetical protein